MKLKEGVLHFSHDYTSPHSKELFEVYEQHAMELEYVFLCDKYRFLSNNDDSTELVYVLRDQCIVFISNSSKRDVRITNQELKSCCLLTTACILQSDTDTLPNNFFSFFFIGTRAGLRFLPDA